MSTLDQLLEKRNLKYEELKPHERLAFDEMSKALDIEGVTVSSLKDYFAKMRHEVEIALTDNMIKKPSFWSFLFRFREEEELKVRLKHYMLLEAFLQGPEERKKEVERQIKAMVDQKTTS